MAGPSRAAKAGASGDGVRITAARRGRKELALLAAALALAALALLAVARWLRPEAPRAAAPAASAAPPEAASRAGAPGVGPASAPHAGASVRVAAKPRRIRGASAPAPPAAPPPAAGRAATPQAPADGGPPTHEEPAFSIGPPGSGIALFPKPGTDPLKIGIVVPEDFPLPEGFVRHHQTTDDGRDLPAILMFHPDYEWVGPDGEPIRIPADRVVPPELAPPGLPIRMLEVPEAATGP